MKTINYKDAAKVFNSKNLAALADGDYSLPEYISRQLFHKREINNFSSFFDLVYDELNRNYRSEYIYKNFLVVRHLLGRHSLNTSTMLSEFRVGTNKADCVILNGKSTCYEIKTEYDSLSRLNDQVEQYQKLFDEVYVVCSEKNFSEVSDSCEASIGILVLSDRSYFRVGRKSSRRTGRIDREALVKSLRKEEYKELTERLAGFVPDVPNGRMFAECKKLVMQSSEADLLSNYCALLKKYRAVKADLIGALPKSLKNAAVSYQFTSKQEHSLMSIFKN